MTFSQFLRCFNEYHRTLERARGLPIGHISIDFVLNYYRNRDEVWERIRTGNLLRAEDDPQLRGVVFLRTATVQRDLVRYLASIGWTEDRLQRIASLGRVNASRPPNDGLDRYYAPEDWQYVRKREAFLLHLFPEFDRGYPF